MNLHDRIMGISTHSRTEEGAGRARDRGALSVKKDALELAKAADELMAEMAEEHSAAMHEAGELMKLMADELGCYADNPETREVLDVYNEYKEQNQ